MANFFNPYQQNFMQQQFAQPQVNNTVLVVPVQGEAGANIYPVAAGNTVFLIDFAAKTFWIKATDANGIPSRFETYEFKNKVIPVQQTQVNNFVSQAEFAELQNQIRQLTASLNSLLSKGDNNAKLNEQSATVSAEVQRICEQLSAKQRRNESSANGTATA